MNQSLIGLVVFGAGFLAMIWTLSRLMAASGRNDELTHGGGMDQSHFGGGN